MFLNFRYIKERDQSQNNQLITNDVGLLVMPHGSCQWEDYICIVYGVCLSFINLDYIIKNIIQELDMEGMNII